MSAHEDTEMAFNWFPSPQTFVDSIIQSLIYLVCHWLWPTQRCKWMADCHTWHLSFLARESNETRKQVEAEHPSIDQRFWCQPINLTLSRQWLLQYLSNHNPEGVFIQITSIKSTFLEFVFREDKKRFPWLKGLYQSWNWPVESWHGPKMIYP